MGNPKVSVVLAVYNGERYLDDAIKSIRRQTLDEFELVIINDGSTDETDSIIREHLCDERLVYLKNKKNMGRAYSRNLGLEAAHADLVAIMDADDISVPERLIIQYQFLKEHPDIDLVGSHVEFIDELGRVTGRREVVTGPDNIRKVFFYYGPHRHPTVMFRKSAVDSVGRYRNYEVCQDIDLYFRLILSGHRTDNIPMYLLRYRVHPESSDRLFRQKGKTSFMIKKEIIKEFDLSLSPVELVSIYVHYLLDVCLSARRKHQVETIVKHVVDRLHLWSAG